MAAVPEVVALLGANLLVGGHHEAIARGEQALSNHGAYLAQTYEASQGKSRGKSLSLSLSLILIFKWKCIE